MALIEHMDAGIGRVVEGLIATGEWENTLLFFVSDNGGQLNVGANCGNWRGGKQDMYEGGIRVPAGVVWPGFLTLLLAGIFAAISSLQIAHWRSSLSLFTHTLTVNPQSVIAAYNLGVAHSNNNTPEDAITSYQDAIAINPSFQPAYNNLGFLLLSQNKAADAVDPLKIAVSLDPDDPDARSNLGLAYDHLQQYSNAIAQHGEALRLSPKDPDILTQLGYSFANNGQLDKAIEAFSAAHLLNPPEPLHLTGLEKIASQTENPQAAKSARDALHKIKQE